MNNILRGSTTFFVILAGIAGCDGGPVSFANFEKIKADGTETLADVEKIMGGKGIETRGDDLKNFDKNNVVGSFAEKLKGKRKLQLPLQDDIGTQAIADENGTEVKWVRWEDGPRSIIVAVLDAKVFMKLNKGFPKQR